MLDPQTLIQTVGLIGVFLIVFTESGLFFGFFLPGDSLLFTAGLLASQGILPIGVLIIGCTIAAILGDTVGYWMGKNMGRRIFTKDTGFFFRKKRLEDAEIFYKNHGKYTIVLARFIPVLRTFAPIVAGIGRMKYSTFLSYNFFGGVFWAILLISLGYFFGKIIPNADTYLLPIIILIVVISLIPPFLPLARKFFKKH